MEIFPNAYLGMQRRSVGIGLRDITLLGQSAQHLAHTSLESRIIGGLGDAGSIGDARNQRIGAQRLRFLK